MGCPEIIINPAEMAFDIDGVVADTMSLYLDIAREEFGVDHIRYEDLKDYSLESVDIDPDISVAVIDKILDGSYSSKLMPIDGAKEVLSRLQKRVGMLTFITARPYVGPIRDWMREVLMLDPEYTDLITTGSYDAKKDVLLSKHKTVFVEDRLETCFHLKSAGVTPILFRQPWNRRKHPFVEVADWNELQALIDI